ncbi:MAG TPA: YCF48-related protein [Blastocatellia bacterium]
MRFFLTSVSLLFLAIAPTSCKKPEASGISGPEVSGSSAKAWHWVAQFRPAGVAQGGVYGALYSFNAISVVSPSVVYAAAIYPDPKDDDARTPIVAKTTDGGANWTEIKLPNPDKKIMRLNAIRFVSPTTGWVAGSDDSGHGLVLGTSDGGANWSATALSSTNLTPTAIYTDGASAFWVGGAGPKPVSNEKPIFVSPPQGGAKGTAGPHNVAGPGPRRVTGAHNAGAPAAGKPGGAGGTKAADEDSGDDGPSDLLFSSDQGSSFAPRYRLPVSIFDLSFVDAQTGWASCNPAAVYHTDNGGRTWDAQQTGISVDTAGTPHQLVALAGISFCDRLHGWIAGGTDAPLTGIVEATTDGGKTWNLLWKPVGETVNDILFISPREGWVASTNGLYVYHSTDGGHTWQVEQITNDQRPSINRLGAADPTHVWAAGGGGIFFREPQ